MVLLSVATMVLFFQLFPLIANSKDKIFSVFCRSLEVIWHLMPLVPIIAEAYQFVRVLLSVATMELLFQVVFPIAANSPPQHFQCSLQKAWHLIPLVPPCTTRILHCLPCTPQITNCLKLQRNPINRKKCVS